MKIWNSYGSEHSANLILIGTFKDAGAAERAKEVIDEITKFVSDSGVTDRKSDRYSDEERALLGRLEFYVRPFELDQFMYDVSIDLKNDQIIIKTDEIEVSAFLKLMIDKGARVEVYSRHDYPDRAQEN